MAKTKEQKKDIVKNLTEQLRQAKGVVFADYTGLKVNEMQKLRQELKKSNSLFTVSKRTMLKRALKEVGFAPANAEAMPGAISVASSSEDEVTPAKIIADFAKIHEALKIQGGILENKFIDIARVKELAELPTKPELLARVVGSIKAPVSGFVNVLAGNLRGLVRVLNALRESRV